MALLKFKARYYRRYPYDDPTRHVEEDVQVDTEKTAFLAVDIYGDWSENYIKEKDISRAGSNSSETNPTNGIIFPDKTRAVLNDIVVSHIKPALDTARGVGLPVIYVSNSGPKIGLAKTEFAKQLKRYHTKNIEVLFEEDCVDPKQYHYGKRGILGFSKIVAPQPDDYLVRKLYYSGFQDTHLDALLRNLGVKTLICVGFWLDICLHCTIIDALNRNYEIFLLRDCTMANEFAEEDKPILAFTKRMITWTECFVGRSADSRDFIRACNSLTK